MSAEGNRSRRRRRALLTAGALGVLALYPPLLSFHRHGREAAFRYFAADAFYYLAVAERSVGSPHFTLDGSHPVNGFHPLWQAGLTQAFRLTGPRPEAQLQLVFAASVALTALGALLFGLAVLRLTGSPAISLLATAPGFYYWLTPTAHPEYGALWTFANGMESPLSVALFGGLVYALVGRAGLRSPTPPRLAALSAALTVLTLARLDDVFLLAPLLALAGLAPGRPRQRAARLAGVAAIPALALGAYLLFNLRSAGAALPLSGVAKASAEVPGLLRNAYATLTTLLPFVDVRDAGLRVWGAEAWRVLQMWLPALAAAAWLLWRRPAALDGREPVRLALSGLAVYVLLKAAYNFAFVGLWQQGQWYYPGSILCFNLMLAAAAGEARERLGLRARRWLPAAVFLLLLLAGSTYAAHKARGPAYARSLAFFERRAATEAALRAACPGCGIVSFDDGLVAYALDIPTMNGLGYMLDVEAAAALRQGRLLELAHARGFRLLGTVHYPIPGLEAGVGLREALSRYRHLEGQDLAGFRFDLAYRDPASGAVFLRFDATSAPR